MYILWFVISHAQGSLKEQCKYIQDPRRELHTWTISNLMHSFQRQGFEFHLSPAGKDGKNLDSVSRANDGKWLDESNRRGTIVSVSTNAQGTKSLAEVNGSREKVLRGGYITPI